MSSSPSADRIAKRLRTRLAIFAILTESAGRATRVLRLTILTLIFPLIAAAAAQLDGTVIIHDGRGYGLLQHAGFLALFASCPVVIIISFLLLDRCAVVIAGLCFTGEIRPSGRMNSLQQRLVSILSFRHPAPVVTLTFAVFIGAALLLVNAHTTSYPYAVYGHDVWDSAAHGYGYYAAKIFLAYTWMYLYPLVATLALSSLYVICSIVNRVTRDPSSVQLPPYAPDGCGGFRPLGKLMLGVVYLDIPFFLILFAMAYTHQSFYSTLKIGAAVLILGVAAEMFLPFLKLHNFLLDVRQTKLSELQSAIETLLHQRSRNEQSRDLALLVANTLYERTSKLSTWPYVATDSIRVTLSLFPMVTTVARLVF